jgi:hypothetical protein
MLAYKNHFLLGTMAHAYNPKYSGGGDLDDEDSRFEANKGKKKLTRPHLNK